MVRFNTEFVCDRCGEVFKPKRLPFVGIKFRPSINILEVFEFKRDFWDFACKERDYDLCDKCTEAFFSEFLRCGRPILDSKE